jgi:hypothetical protein
MKMSLPKQFGDAPLFLCPKDPYLDMMALRNSKFEQV